MQHTLAEQFAQFAVKAEISPTSVDIVRHAVADCFGCILTGIDSEVAVRLNKGLDIDGQGTAPVYGTGRKTLPAYAALANSVAGHAYDLDDWEEPANSHPTVVLLPACLAAAHNVTVSGKQMMTAYAVGFEVIARLGEAVTLDHYNRGFHTTSTIASIGAAAAVARLLGLDIAAATHALSIATSQASGYTMQFGTNAKPLQAGFAARVGFESACLAQAGATANPDVIDSDRGFAGLLGVCGRPLKELGNPWALDEYGLLLKPWPSCGYTHRLMTAATALQPVLSHRLNDITAIEANLPDFHKIILPYDRPQTREQALFSAHACIAQILLEGDLTMQDLAEGFWKKPRVEKLMRITEVLTAPAKKPLLNIDPQQPDILRIYFDNEMIEQSCSYPLGAPQNPMSQKALETKFTANSGRSKNDFQHLVQWHRSPDIGTWLEVFEARANP